MSDVTPEETPDAALDVPVEVEPAPEPVTPEPVDEAPEEEVPVLNLSAGAGLPTSDGYAPDQIEVTEAVTSEKKLFIVWDAVGHVVVSGPFVSADDAQIDVDYRSAKNSRATNWTEPSYSIEAVSDAT